MHAPAARCTTMVHIERTAFQVGAGRQYTATMHDGANTHPLGTYTHLLEPWMHLYLITGWPHRSMFQK